MTQTAVDDVWLREPRLLVPRMQPLGFVTLDVQNPLTRDLAVFTAFVGGVPTELVSRLPMTPVASPGKQIIRGNVHTSCNGSSQYFVTQKPFTVKTPFTLITITNGIGTVNNTGFVAFANTTTNDRCIVYRQTSANNFSFFVAAADYSQRTFSSAENAVVERKFCAFIYNSAGDMPFYVNNVLKSTVTDRSQSNFANPATCTLVWNAMTGTSISGYSTCPVEYAAVWNRSLTPTELTALFLDPYQILILA
jgi:hypothetical protein